MTERSRLQKSLRKLPHWLLNLGASEDLRESLRLRIQITNGLALLASTAAFFYSLVFLGLEHKFLTLACTVQAATFLIPLFLNATGYITAARYFMLANGSLSVMVFSVIYGPDSGFRNFFIAIAASVSTYFDHREKKHTTIAIIAVLICYALAAIGVRAFPALALLDRPTTWMMEDSFQAIILLIVLICIFTLGIMNRRTEFSLETTLETIQKERDFNLSIIDSAPNLILITDLEGHILTFNRACQRATGVPFEIARTRSIQQWIPDLTDCPNASRIVFQIPERNLRWVNRDGTARIFNLLQVFTPASVGRPEAILWVGEDITDTLSFKTKLQEQERLLEASQQLAAMGEMSASIAHEINNPLAVIRLQNERILGRIEREPELKLLQAGHLKIEEMVQRISKIIRSLQSLAGKSDQDPFEQASLQGVVGETLELVREKYQTKDFPIRIHLDEPSLRFECRPIQISQVLVNLLNNSYDSLVEKRTRHPDSQPYVEIRSECETDELNRRCIRIHVIDSGIGLDALTMKQLGQPLFSTKPRGKGMGVGLRLSQAIVESHSGALAFSSLPEYGLTRFSITLPLEQNLSSAL